MKSRTGRSIIAMFVSTLMLALLFSPRAAAADPPGWKLENPIQPNYNCAGRDTTFYVKVASCIHWFGYPNSHMYGYVGIDFKSGLNRSNVQRCTIWMQLKSSYGTLTQPVRFANCYDIAKEGGERWYTTGLGHDWGTGRRIGDDYWQYAWIVIETGTLYDGREDAAVVRTTK